MRRREIEEFITGTLTSLEAWESQEPQEQSLRQDAEWLNGLRAELVRREATWNEINEIVSG